MNFVPYILAKQLVNGLDHHIGEGILNGTRESVVEMLTIAVSCPAFLTSEIVPSDLAMEE